MAVPKKKVSPSRQGMRGAHRRVKIGAVSSCAHCGKDRYSHHVCLHCGYYKGVRVFLSRSQQREQKVKEGESQR